MDFRDYVRILYRRIGVLSAVALTIICGYLIMLRSKPDLFEAVSVLTITEPPLVWQISDKELPPISETLSSKAQIELLRSTPFLRDLIQKAPELAELFPVDPVPDDSLPAEERQRLRLKREQQIYDQVTRLRYGFSVEPVTGSEFVRVVVRDLNAERAVKISSAVARGFEDFARKRAVSNVIEAEQFLQGRIDEMEGKGAGPDVTTKNLTLPFLYREVTRLRNEVAAADAKGESGRRRKQIEDLSSELNRLEREIHNDTVTLKYLRKSAESGDIAPAASSPLSQTVRETGTQYDQARKRLGELRQRYLPQHPEVVAAAGEVQRLRQELDRLTEMEGYARRVASKLDLVEKVIPELETRLSTRSERREIVRQELSASEQALEEALHTAGTGPAAHELLRAESQMRFAEANYLHLQTDLDRLSVQKKLARSLVALVSVPESGQASPLPKQGVLPLPLLCVLAFAAGVVVCYLLEFTTTTVRTEYEVKRYVNLPLLDIVFKIREPDQRLLLNIAPKSALAERFNTLGAILSSYAAENEAKIFMLTSSKEGEGKSTVVSNMAVALARSGDRVILIDCDLRKSIQHKFFNIDNTRGLTNHLLEVSRPDPAAEAGAETLTIDAILRPTGVEGLQLIPAGPTPKNPVGLLKSEAFRNLLAECRRRADYVLIDVPPVNVAVDTMILCPLVDGVVLLVSADSTHKDEITNAKRLLETAKGHLMGCILNKATIQSRGYYYYYYHYYYDRYRYYREA